MRGVLANRHSRAGLVVSLSQADELVIDLDDPATEADRAIFEQQIAMSGDDEPARELLCDLALALMDAKWKGVLNTTKDFVVFAANYAQDRPQDALAASVPPKQLAEFRRKGWL